MSLLFDRTFKLFLKQNVKDQNFNERSTNVQIFDNLRVRVGKNLIVNRLTVINNLIDYQ